MPQRVTPALLKISFLKCTSSGRSRYLTTVISGVQDGQAMEARARSRSTASHSTRRRCRYVRPATAAPSPASAAVTLMIIVDLLDSFRRLAGGLGRRSGPPCLVLEEPRAGPQPAEDQHEHQQHTPTDKEPQPPGHTPMNCTKCTPTNHGWWFRHRWWTADHQRSRVSPASH